MLPRNVHGKFCVPTRLAPLALTILSVFCGCGGGETSTPGLSGTYEASQGNDKMTLVLKSGNVMELTMEVEGQKETQNGTYAVDGNKVTISTDQPGGTPMVLTRNGDVLESPVGMSFKKK